MASVSSSSQAIQLPKTSLKRNHDASDDCATPPRSSRDTPQKRQKVTFSPTIRVRTIATTMASNSVVEKPLSLVKEEVRIALARHRNNDNDLYNDLIELFTTHPQKDGAPSLLTYRRHLTAITSQAFLLGRDLDCTELLQALLGSYWLERDERAWADFQRFLASLLTVHAVYLPTICNWLVIRLQEYGPTSTGVSRDLFNDRIIRTFISISKYVPDVDSLLGESIASSFPFRRATLKSYLAYIQNILTLAKDFPSLQAGIARLIIDKVIAIDASIGVNIDALDEDDMEFLEKQLREEMVVLLATDEAEAEKTAEEEEEADQAGELLKTVQIMKEDMLKLDIVIGLLFKHFQEVLSKEVKAATIINGECSLYSSRTFSCLISTFESGILTQWTSRHTQYLLFRFAQLQPEFYTIFTNHLIKIAFNRDGATPIRMAAISYLASFVARAAKVTDEQVLHLFQRLSKELEKLRNKYESISKVPDPEQFRFYYTLFQACMYIFCFRWNAFLLNPDDDEHIPRQWAPGINALFAQNMHSPLNPLKVCSPIVTEQFAKVSQSLSFLYVYTKLAANKRVRLTRVVQPNSLARETALTINSSESSLRLEWHSGFEPYALPVSRDWVRMLYVEFSERAPPGFEDDDDDDESSEEEEEEAREGVEEEDEMEVEDAEEHGDTKTGGEEGHQ